MTILNHIIPNNQHGYSFDPEAVLCKKDLNREFMRTPINSNVAIVWYHKGLLSHAGLSLEGQPFGFALGSSTPEPDSLENYIEEIKDGSRRFCKAITVQYLKMSPIKKRKIEKIVEKGTYSCFTCMHAVSKILAKTTNIKIPLMISQLPDTSLVYLKYLQQSGNSHLMKQRTYGQTGLLFNNHTVSDFVNRFLQTNLIASVGTALASYPLYYMNGEVDNWQLYGAYLSAYLLASIKIDLIMYKAFSS